MSKDIHKWTDGRYTLMFDEHTFFVWDNENDERMTALNVTKKLNEQQATINKQEEIIKSQDMEISRQYNLCLAMSGVLREEFGVYDVFDRTKDRKID